MVGLYYPALELHPHGKHLSEDAHGGYFGQILTAASLQLYYTKARFMRHPPERVRTWTNARLDALWGRIGREQ